jgi:ubiquitin carboxyl-terminal hydrolase 8
MDLTRYNDKGLIGLHNLGNTCYINACIQVLSNTYELHNVIHKESFQKHLKNDDDGIITKEWNDLQNVMWSKNGKLSPQRFIHFVREVARKKGYTLFSGYSQNDSCEFVMFFLEIIHKSASRQVSFSINGNPHNDTDKLAMQCYKTKKEIYEKEYSEMLDLFYGLSFRKIVSIATKKVHIIKPELFFLLNLPVMNNNTQLDTIDECLQAYFTPEALTGENAWYNEETKEKEDVYMETGFWNIPRVFVINLSRFSPLGQKIQHIIDFPINNLDMSSYVSGYNSKEYVYELYGIVNHLGNMNNGHYTAFVKNSQNQWYHYDDEVIQKVSNESQLKTPHAYCLFYRQKNSLS